MKKKSKKQGHIAFLFLLPLIFFFLLFRMIPAISVFFLSFTSYDVLSAPKWIGLLNYKELIFNLEYASRSFWISTWNTLYYSGGQLFLEMSVGLALALLVNAKIKMRNFFRTAFYVPVVTSFVAVSMIWLWLYHPQIGLFNYFLKVIGLSPQKWLKDPNLAMLSIIIMSSWHGAGWSMVIYLAGLQTIPQSLYEAGQIDGATRWQSFWHITLPCLKPTTLFIVVMGCITNFQVFDQIYVLTQGGPVNRTVTVTYQIWEHSFRFFRLGYGCAMSFILLLIILGISLINQKFFGEEIEY